MPFCYIPGLESNVRLTLLTMPYDPTFAGRANPFLTTSSLPVLNKSNTADSVTSQERGLDSLLHKLYLKWTLDVAQQPVTQQQLLSTFTTLPTLRSSVLDLRGTATSHLAQRGDASLHLLLLTHACANMHTEARTNMDDPAHRSTHANTPRLGVCFPETGFPVEGQVSMELTGGQPGLELKTSLLPQLPTVGISGINSHARFCISSLLSLEFLLLARILSVSLYMWSDYLVNQKQTPIPSASLLSNSSS